MLRVHVELVEGVRRAGRDPRRVDFVDVFQVCIILIRIRIILCLLLLFFLLLFFLLILAQFVIHPLQMLQGATGTNRVVGDDVLQHGTRVCKVIVAEATRHSRLVRTHVVPIGQTLGTCHYPTVSFQEGPRQRPDIRHCKLVQGRAQGIVGQPGRLFRRRRRWRRW